MMSKPPKCFKCGVNPSTWDGEDWCMCIDCTNKMRNGNKDALKHMRENSIESLLTKAGVPKRYHRACLSDFRYKDKVKAALKPDKGFMLCGQAGKGKTHLLCAIARHLLIEGLDVHYTNFAYMIEELRAGISDNSSHDLLKYYTTVPYLMLDDMGVIGITDYIYNQMYLILDIRYSNMLHTSYAMNIDVVDLCDDRAIRRITESTIKIEMD